MGNQNQNDATREPDVWEYHCERINSFWRPDNQSRLNALGSRGWELVEKNAKGECVFKRRKVAS